MTVAILKTKDPRGVREAVGLLGGMERFVAEGEQVILKPNICVGKPNRTGVVTNPELVAEVARMVQEVQGYPTVGESPIYPLGGKNAFQNSGYGDFQARYGFEMVAFDREEGVHIQVPRGRVLDHQVIARRVLKADKLINLPIAKTHGLTTVTLGLKNIKGAVPGKQKQIIHITGLDEGIVDLNTVIRSDLTIIDGIIGLEGEFGPTRGDIVDLGLILASDNVVEADAVMARIMGIDPETIPHIRMAAERGLGKLHGIEILGEPVARVVRPFRHIRMPGVVRSFFNRGVGGITSAYHNMKSRFLGTDRIEPSRKVAEIRVEAGRCNECKLCLKACPVNALSLDGGIRLDRKACIRCYICGEVCPEGVFSLGT